MRGFCKLTLKEGIFAKAHLIPRALTKNKAPGDPWFETGEDKRPIKRFTSWYDKHLVSHEGEAILARHDDIGVKLLRELGLVWSASKHCGINTRIIDSEMGWGIHEVETSKGQELRSFLLSILWRFAASKRLEAKEIDLDSSELERLRAYVVNPKKDKVSDFPISMTVLSTVGEPHNQSPIRVTHFPPEFQGMTFPPIDCFRFYLDGLIVNFGTRSDDEYLANVWAPSLVGASESFIVSTVPFEKSFQRENITNHKASAATFFAE